ncbi:ribonuclease III domain-containing protein [uncultured Treponema sp.]|uniref:ribonuclease III domain-containing protein n=1 Tax=uncultured Treponema sp. TaxID=162155 RepID=UPI0025FEDAD4|nr:ribonuclease III domain-containing protein [uncultured Treponema sp.]
MDETTLSLIQQKIGYQFVNPVLLKQAFISPSLSVATQNRVQNYQILEFIGDAVLGLAVVKNLASEFCHVDASGQFVSSAPEGQLSEEKSRLVKNEKLAHCSNVLEFDSYLERAHGYYLHDRKNKKGDLIESILGAVAIDSNWNMDVLSRVASELLRYDKTAENATEKLQNYCKKNGLDLPTYSFWNCGLRYDCAVSLQSVNGFFVGNGKTVEEAQNVAVESAYTYLTGQNVTKKKSVEQTGANILNSSKKSPTAVEILNLKYIKKEIGQPNYSFAQTAENGKLFWICTLTLNNNENRVLGKATTRKKAKQAAAKAMLELLENLKQEEKSISSRKLSGIGLLKRAMILRENC